MDMGKIFYKKDMSEHFYKKIIQRIHDMDGDNYYKGRMIYRAMVFTLGGNSGTGAHVCIELGYLTRLRHL